MNVNEWGEMTLGAEGKGGRERDDSRRLQALTSGRKCASSPPSRLEGNDDGE
jgi:hypothetical protein